MARTFPYQVCLITGAGSGIGRALATELARRGSKLALCDVDEDGLSETARAVGDESVLSRRVDVADREVMHDVAEAALAHYGRVDAIFNNAGVSVAQTLVDTSYEDFEWLMNINFWGVVHGSLAFLPILERQDEGHIVNISSVFGIISAPLNGTYNAAKFAVQ